MSKKKYIVFWGCQIPSRFPYIEKAARFAFPRLGLEVADLSGFTCCPESWMAQNLPGKTWLLTALRNLALVEQAGADGILTPCNGCYATFKSALHHFILQPELQAEVRERLSRIGLSFQGRVVAKHLIEVLYEEISPDSISFKASGALRGMRLAAHPGCHMLRPGEGVSFDHPFAPFKLEALISALGAQVVDYPSKLLCCGESLNRGTQPKQSLNLVRSKLLELAKLGVDGLVVTCPACFLQFDMQQFILQRQGDGFGIPVFHYAEILALALGGEAADLGLKMHRIKPDKFLADWAERRKRLAEVARLVDLAAVERCYACGACEEDCPARQNVAGFSPREVVRRVLLGEIEALLSAAEIWHCLECHTCVELCPNRFGMEKVFAALRKLAVERGFAPDTVRGMMEMFSSSGRLTQVQKGTRKKLGLPELAEEDYKDWKELLRIGS